MDFDIGNVHTMLNAGEVSVGSKGYFSDSLKNLKDSVELEHSKYYGEIAEIKDASYASRFKIKDDYCYILFYPVEGLIYPVDNSKDITLTMSTVSKLCGKDSASNTYTLLACCADKIVEATKLYTKWDLDIVHLVENKSEFTRALVDLICHCGKIAYREYINLDKALAVRLLNDKQEEVKVEKN